MTTIDMTHRKLNFPPRFLPYLEKHRIFELLHECVELLVQVKPRDHIKFLKNVMPCAAMKRDKQRIVFLTPTSFDRETFSELLADCLGIQVINLSILDMLTREKQQFEQVKIEVLSETVEEESCICPGESPSHFSGQFVIPGESPGQTLERRGFYYPSTVEEEPDAFLGKEESYSGESVKEEEELQPEEPCICVCPCVKAEKKTEEKTKEKSGEKTERETESERKTESEEKTDSERKTESEGEIGVSGEGEYTPCEPYEKKKGKGYEKSRTSMTKKDEDRRNLLPFDVVLSESSEFSLREIDFGILAECEQGAKGWILADYPKTGEEAEKLNALGVIPTHALRIILDEEEEERDKEYKEIVKGWMKAYKYVPVLEIRRQARDIPELVKDMCSLLSLMPHRHAPMLPRVVLIGSRGSGVTTQAQKLARKYGLVHVEFELVISRALQQDDEMCKMYKLQLATRPDPELEALLLERALLTSQCRNRGWVLTGYPRNIDQMRMLDIIATPPNRVIFIKVPARECFVRLYYRKVDPCLGDEYKIPTILPSGADSYEAPDLEPEIAKRLLSHPKNNRKQIIHDIEEYFVNKEDMMAYCGKTASYVDGNQEVDRVFEQIEQVLINPAPPHPPRDPLAVNFGIAESYQRLKTFRLASGKYFNSMMLNPPK